MLELTFLTTNIVKLAHARYLCRNNDVNIIQHKILHYGKSYEEPRLFEREKLLEESLKDAKRRWKKYASENKFFFIEDTSVKIHALSTPEKEYPGVDIKYWMNETTFEQLDLNLKQKGNDRHVTVFSHLLLGLTKDLEEIFHTDHFEFKSQAEGYITDREYIFETNILYPWLDNRSFNKWFVPIGKKYPVSMLSIEDSYAGDFRKGAFESMLSFLLNHNKLHKKKKHEINLRFVFEPLFLITGPTCAGKTTIGKYLLENYNYYHIEASDFMALEFHETHGNKSQIDIGEFAKAILKVNPYVVVNRILWFLNENPKISSVVITGFRTPAELKYFTENSPLQGNEISIFIIANYEIRFQRWVNRNRDISDNLKEKFDKINQIQKEIGILSISELENFTQLENNSTFNDYYDLFDETFLTRKPEKNKINHIDFSALQPTSLEDAILFTLANDYRSSDQAYLTTTAISRKINKTFISLAKEKHKDNVSRYFNQRFYPYYEIKEIDKKLKYKLSPTGYSKAISIVKNII